jgi:hypothetical protein
VLSRNRYLHDARRWRRDGQSIFSHSFDMEFNPFPDQLLRFLDCRGRHAKSRQIRNIGAPSVRSLLKHNRVFRHYNLRWHARLAPKATADPSTPLRFPVTSLREITQSLRMTTRFELIAVILAALCTNGPESSWNSGPFFRQSNDLYAALALAALACSTSLVNPAESFTAISARILRSSSTPAILRPLMNCE